MAFASLRVGWMGILMGCLFSGLGLQAQSLPTHPVRSISPTDADFSDLAFLRQEIGGARVVMLGEPSHGEGNVTEAKIRLIRFLQREMGFTTVAFESGFYELDRAQRAMQSGTPVAEAIDNSVFPVWTGTREFQQLLPLLGPGQLKVTGFDYQLSGGYQDELLDELEALLKPEKGGDGIAYDYLEECLSTMGENFLFPPSHQLPLFDLQIGKARRLLEKIAAGPDAARRERATFWLQNLHSLQVLAHDYATNDPGTKSENEFKAVDSNPRDAQMADNLLWYLRQHPREKVICWGALPHLANRVEVLADAEIQTYKPMGRAVKAALGPEAVYVLGTLAGSGTHGFPRHHGFQPVPAPAVGTLEAELLAQGNDYAFVSLKHDTPGRELTTYAFEYKPQTGPWSEIVDGFLFLKAVNPPHGALFKAPSSDTTAAPAVAASSRALGRMNPAAKPALAATGALLDYHGTVLDYKTGQPVPYATVAVPARSTGTVADAQGHFRLEVRRAEQVQVSCIGYEPVVLTAGAAPANVRLVPAAFALATVRVSARSQNPRRIMQQVIKAVPANYEQRDYTQQRYAHWRVMGFDTLRHELEYTAQEWTPAEYHHWAGGFLMLESQPLVKVQEKHLVKGSDHYGPYHEGGYGFAGGFDVVRVSPLFKAATLGKFRLQLDSIVQQGGETVYVISFQAKRASQRATGVPHVAGYMGKVYVRQQDYAVLRYESLWQHDTVKVNAIARKYHGTGKFVAKLYPSVLHDHRSTHVVTYQRGSSGHYYAAASVAQSRVVGHVLSGAPIHTQYTCEVYYEAPSVVPSAEIPTRKTSPGLDGTGIYQVAKVPHRPAFWQTFQRPVPAETAPTLEATKP